MEDVDPNIFSMAKICHPIPNHKLDNQTKISKNSASSQYCHVILLALEYAWTAFNHLHIYPTSAVPMDSTVIFLTLCLDTLHWVYTCTAFITVYRFKSN